jgi:hypothetical protein
MTLDQFLRDNQEDLIRRTRIKVAARSSPAVDPSEVEHGVLLFLSQLSAALVEQGTGDTDDSVRVCQAVTELAEELDASLFVNRAAANRRGDCRGGDERAAAA